MDTMKPVKMAAMVLAAMVLAGGLCKPAAARLTPPRCEKDF